jgi:hypothetical protein
MSSDDLADAQRERSELIEQALLMNLILSIDTGPERVEVAPPQIAAPPRTPDEDRPPASED